jgi:hypothetical protein
MFYNAVELSAEASTFLLIFLEVYPYFLASFEYRIGAFSEYNILPRLSLVSSVYIELIFGYRLFVFLESREFFELLRGCFP